MCSCEWHWESQGDRFCEMFAYLSKPGSFLPKLVRALGILLAIQTSALLPDCDISPELLLEDPSLRGATCLLGLREHSLAGISLWVERGEKQTNKKYHPVSSFNVRSSFRSDTQMSNFFTSSVLWGKVTRNYLPHIFQYFLWVFYPSSYLLTSPCQFLLVLGFPHSNNFFTKLSLWYLLLRQNSHDQIQTQAEFQRWLV